MPNAASLLTSAPAPKPASAPTSNQKTPTGLNVFRLEGLPHFKTGDRLADLLIAHLDHNEIALVNGDILVIAHKVVSKCEGALRRLSEVTPTQSALDLAESVRKDPRKVQIIIDQSKRILRAVRRPEQQEGVLIAEHKRGYICANAAVDESNSDDPDILITLPDDPDASAKAIADQLEAHFGITLGVIISDTFGRPWRLGQTNVAIGVANVPALNLMAGETDAYGRPLTVTAPALADELAAASGLLMDKSAQTPVIVFRGLDWQATDSSGQDLIRAQQEDLFR